MNIPKNFNGRLHWTTLFGFSSDLQPIWNKYPYLFLKKTQHEYARQLQQVAPTFFERLIPTKIITRIRFTSSLPRQPWQGKHSTSGKHTARAAPAATQRKMLPSTPMNSWCCCDLLNVIIYTLISNLLTFIHLIFLSLFPLLSPSFSPSFSLFSLFFLSLRHFSLLQPRALPRLCYNAIISRMTAI